MHPSGWTEGGLTGQTKVDNFDSIYTLHIIIISFFFFVGLKDQLWMSVLFRKLNIKYY